MCGCVSVIVCVRVSVGDCECARKCESVGDCECVHACECESVYESVSGSVCEYESKSTRACAYLFVT